MFLTSRPSALPATSVKPCWKMDCCLWHSGDFGGKEDHSHAKWSILYSQGSPKVQEREPGLWSQDGVVWWSRMQQQCGALHTSSAISRALCVRTCSACCNCCVCPILGCVSVNVVHWEMMYEICFVWINMGYFVWINMGYFIWINIDWTKLFKYYWNAICAWQYKICDQRYSFGTTCLALLFGILKFKERWNGWCPHIIRPLRYMPRTLKAAPLDSPRPRASSSYPTATLFFTQLARRCVVAYNQEIAKMADHFKSPPRNEHRYCNSSFRRRNFCCLTIDFRILG